jgi:hypothetical protein
MPLSPYSDIPGRKGYTFWLPSDIDIRTEVVNHASVRSYREFTGQTKTIVHDTGNPNTTADGEFKWLKDGRPGGGAGGYNAITDADEIILCGMFNEIMWHGGTPSGNQTFGVEMAFGGGQNWDKVWTLNSALHGAICAAFGWDASTAAKMHQWIYGKRCSGQIINRNMWPQVLTQIGRDTKNARDAAAGGGQPTPDPGKYAPAVPIKALDEAMKAAANEDPSLTVAPRQVYDPSSKVTFFWVGDRVEAIRDTRRRQFATIGSPDVGGIIKIGTQFDVNWLFTAGDDNVYYLTPYNTRVLAEDTKRISDNKAGTA